MPVEFQSDWKSLNLNLATSSINKSLQWDVNRGPGRTVTCERPKKTLAFVFVSHIFIMDGYFQACVEIDAQTNKKSKNPNEQYPNIPG